MQNRHLGGHMVRALATVMMVINITHVADMHAKKPWGGPDFLIIGAQKAGTSALWKYLKKHPRIKWASKKEVHFFDTHYRKGLSWYEKQFLLKDKNSDFLTGEATPGYIFHPLGAQRISAVFPNVKLILLLRDPVARAFSHYKMYVRRDIEKRSFEQALAEEGKMVKIEREKMIASGEGGYWSEQYAFFSYVSRGFYLDQIKQFMRYFDKDQLLVINSDDLLNKTEETVNKILRFLELEEMVLPHYEHYHVAPNHEVVMSPETKALLKEKFRPFNKKLQDYLRHDLGQDIVLNWD